MGKEDYSSWPAFTLEEADKIREVLLSNRVNYWTGTEGREFEKEFSRFCDVDFSVALANGTVALELALRVTGIGPGDEVVVTPRTFIASASAIIAVGAKPVFADVDSHSQNITPESVGEVITERTAAIVAVHLAGWPCDMSGLMCLADKHGLKVIEDCAQAHGAKYMGLPVGSLGHAAAWSFCQDKIMTTGGEGGMFTTNDRALWEKAWAFKDHGKSWNAVYKRVHPPGFRWLHESFGTNWRMTEIQAAIGRIQLKRMQKWHELRVKNAETILSACDDFKTILRVPRPSDKLDHAWYKCYVFVRPEGLRAGWSRDRVMEEINAKGVPCYSGSCAEIYLEKAFEDTGFRPDKRLPVARELGETSLMFLVHPTLSEADIKKACETIVQVMRQAAAQ